MNLPLVMEQYLHFICLIGIVILVTHKLLWRVWEDGWFWLPFFQWNFFVDAFGGVVVFFLGPSLLFHLLLLGGSCLEFFTCLLVGFFVVWLCFLNIGQEPRRLPCRGSLDLEKNLDAVGKVQLEIKPHTAAPLPCLSCFGEKETKKLGEKYRRCINKIKLKLNY